MYKQKEKRVSTLDEECYVAKTHIEKLNLGRLNSLGAQLATILKNSDHKDETWCTGLSNKIFNEIEILKKCAKNANPDFDKTEIMQAAIRMVS